MISNNKDRRIKMELLIGIVVFFIFIGAALTAGVVFFKIFLELLWV